MEERIAPEGIRRFNLTLLGFCSTTALVRGLILLHVWSLEAEIREGRIQLEHICHNRSQSRYLR